MDERVNDQCGLIDQSSEKLLKLCVLLQLLLHQLLVAANIATEFLEMGTQGDLFGEQDFQLIQKVERLGVVLLFEKEAKAAATVSVCRSSLKFLSG